MLRKAVNLVTLAHYVLMNKNTPVLSFDYDLGDHKAVRIREVFAPEAASRVREEFAPDVIDVAPDGFLSVTVFCQPSDRMLHHLFSYGAQLEILEPVWVHDWMNDQARAMLERGR